MSDDASAELEPGRTPVGVLLRRMLVYSKPYLGILAAAFVCAMILAAGRFGRAYLMKPLLDDVMMPYHTVSSGDTKLSAYQDFAVGESVAGSPAGTSTELTELTELTKLAVDKSAQQERAAGLEEIRASFRHVLQIALLIVISMPLSMFGRYYLISYALERVALDIRCELAAKLLVLPLSFHHGSGSGDVLSRTLRDSEHGRRSLDLFYGEFLESAIMVTIGVSTMIYLSWQLSLVGLLVVPSVLGIVVFFGRKIYSRALQRQAMAGEVTQRLITILSGIKIIKAFRGEAREYEAFRNSADQLFRRSMKVIRHGALSQSMVEALNAAVAIGMVMLGTLIVLQGSWGLTGGGVAAFAAVLGTSYRPIKVLSRGWGSMVEALASSDRFFEVLDAKEETPDSATATRIDGVRESVRFENVSFSYGREPVLRGVTFEAHPGEVIAIVGRSGEGKSTLMDLLLRFSEVDSGSIRVDGIDVREISRDSLLDSVAIVTQEAFLFDATILENIRYGRPDASDEDVLAAAEAAHVAEFVAQLPDGYQTEAGEAGLRLSGGQRQRITIARALLKDPAILICDEATSSLDAKTERPVQEAIDAMQGERMVFVIAHRLSTIHNADRILVLEDGRVSQMGTHDELMLEGGLYRELVELQTEGATV